MEKNGDERSGAGPLPRKDWDKQSGSGRPGTAKGRMDKPARAGGLRFKRYERVQLSPVEAALEEARIPWQPTERWVQEQFKTGPFMEPSIRVAVEQFRTLVGKVMGAADVATFMEAQQEAVRYVGQHPFLRWAPVPSKLSVPQVKAAPEAPAGAVKRPVRLPALGRPAGRPGAERPGVGRPGVGLPGVGRPTLGKPGVARPVREPRVGGGEARFERPARKFGPRPEGGERPERVERREPGDRPERSERRPAGPLGLPTKAGARPVKVLRKPGFGDKPAGRFGDKPAGRFGDKPAGRFGDKPAGRFGDKPAGRFGDKPAGRFGDKPAGRFGDKPAGRFGDKPAGRFGDKPAGKFAGKPAGRFAGKPAGKFARKPGGKPGARGARKPLGAPVPGERPDSED